MSLYNKECSCGSSYSGYSSCPYCTIQGVKESIQEIEHHITVLEADVERQKKLLEYKKKKLQKMEERSDK